MAGVVEPEPRDQRRGLARGLHRVAVARGIEVGSRQHVQQLDEGALLGAPGLPFHRDGALEQRHAACRMARHAFDDAFAGQAIAPCRRAGRRIGAGKPLRGLGDRGACPLHLAVARQVARSKTLQLRERQPFTVLAQQRLGLGPERP